MASTLDLLRLLSRAYTRPMFAQLARTGDIREVSELLKKHGLVDQELDALR